LSPCVALASQCLPHVEKLSAKSISQWAAKAGPWLIQQLHDHEGPWRLHVFHVPAPDKAVNSARCRYIEQAIESLLRKKQRRLLRTWNRDFQASRRPDERLVQIGLRTPTDGYLSSITANEWYHWRRCISRYPGGTVEIASDRRAPSRALAKLAEVEIRLDRPIRPDETCVDLGSSPGSWAFQALARGATVVAVDRSPLRTDLMGQERLTFLRGDALRYRPPGAVDWLLCDVIAFPGRTIELVERWLSEGWCRFFCVTVKFRGRADYDQLEPLKAWLVAAGHDFYLRRLTSNKNEVMVFGAVAGAAKPLSGGL
jgi:23S rRNA (cytidine2498-2'-O)-methyltransferase